MKTQKRILIEHDIDAQSPRDWDNLGTMVCWHGRYNLGDEQPDSSPMEWKLQMAEEFEPGIEERVERFADRLDRRHPGSSFEWHVRQINDYQAEKVDEILDRHIISLPLYLYDHSGITMNTAGFSCSWDSGQVGLIYVSIAEVKKEFGWKRLTRKRLRQIEDHLKAEVEVYDQFIRGEVYGFTVETEDGDVEDSCWGFFGRDPFTNGMAGHIDPALHPLLKEAA